MIEGTSVLGNHDCATRMPLCGRTTIVNADLDGVNFFHGITGATALEPMTVEALDSSFPGVTSMGIGITGSAPALTAVNVQSGGAETSIGITCTDCPGARLTRIGTEGEWRSRRRSASAAPETSAAWLSR